MGNLLGSPITEKDTHTGITLDEHSLDNGGLGYGISSMQGWRVHMEDAHIVQPFLYAEKKKNNNTEKKSEHGSKSNCEGVAIELCLSSEEKRGGNNKTTTTTTTDEITTKVIQSSNTPINSNNNSGNGSKYTQIALPNHSLFAIFDGHGGSFAAEYASRNLLRVLSRQSKFVQYAEKWRDREDYLRGVQGGVSYKDNNSSNEKEKRDGRMEPQQSETTNTNTSTTTEEEDGDVDKQRLQELLQRGRESDETVEKIKERVRRHLGGGREKEEEGGSLPNTIKNDNSTTSTTTTQQQQQQSKEGWWQSTTTTATNNNNTPSTPQQPPPPNKHHLTLPTTPQNNTNAIQIATAAYDHDLMILLESSLRDAFVDLDKEIFEEVSASSITTSGGNNVGMGSGSGGNGGENEDRNMVYGVGYPFGDGSSSSVRSGGVGHLPKGGVVGDGEDETGSSTSSSSSSAVEAGTHHHQQQQQSQQQQQQQPPLPPPTPSDDEDSGTTATIVLITPRWIVCANAGDSRAVYSRSNHRVVPLSYDHKPDDEEEERRIHDAGGYVSAGRVEGDLAVSRGLGDFRFKEEEAVLSGAHGENRDDGGGSGIGGGGGGSSNGSNSTNNAARNSNGSMLKPGDQKVSPVPDIIVQNRDRAEDEFIIIACDGIWDVQTNQECVQMVADMFREGEQDLGLVCEEILDLCLIKGSKDNMTAAVIKFPKQVVGQGGGVMARRERRGAADDEGGDHAENVHFRRVYNPYIPKETNYDDEES
jgi:serine/threonine protein phosphatase PrpC